MKKLSKATVNKLRVIASQVESLMTDARVVDKGFKIVRRPPSWRPAESEFIRHDGFFIVPQCELHSQGFEFHVMVPRDMEWKGELAIDPEELEYREPGDDPNPDSIPEVFFDEKSKGSLDKICLSAADLDDQDLTVPMLVIKQVDPEVLSLWQGKIDQVKAIWDKYKRQAAKIVSEHRDTSKFRAQRKKFAQSCVKFLSELEESKILPNLKPELALKVFQLDPDFLSSVSKFSRRNLAQCAALTKEEMEEILHLFEVHKVHAA